MSISNNLTSVLLGFCLVSTGAFAGGHEKHGSHDKDMRNQYADMANNHSGMVKYDIVELASNDKNFETLIAAVKAAGLVEILQGDGPFTLFAPTDDAFAALPEGTLENLLKPENKEQLIDILTYHVVPGAIQASAVTGLDTAKTVQGGRIQVRASGDSVMVDDARVTTTDIVARNGVIHVIDKVMVPKS